MAKILVTDGMAEAGVQALVAAGHEVDLRKVDESELLSIIGDYDGLVVRSATEVTAAVLQAGAPRLRLVGRAGVGVDNVDTSTATQLGIIVMNAPLGNILSAAEHTIGMVFAIARNIPQAASKLQAGTWDKKSHIGIELHGKTLGIVGLGKIGKHVAEVLQAAGMQVMAYDPFLTREVAESIGIEPVEELDDLLMQADVITLHTPLTDKTRNMIDAHRLRLMKKTARLVNVARGGIVDEQALAEALQTGAIAGAALDVFAQEPIESDHPLLSCPTCICTPHLGASTEEAQVRVSTDIADQFNIYFDEGRIVNAVNVQLRVDPAIDDYLQAAEQLGALVVQTLEKPLRSLELRARGELASYDTRPLATAALKGALAQITEETVNVVNAQLIAEQRGIDLTHSSTQQLRDWLAQLMIKATTSAGDHIIGGSLVNGQLRVMRFDDYRLDLPVEGNLLIIEYPDRPGMVGQYGSILGKHQINIARMEVCRVDGRGDALVILTVDDPVSDAVLEELTQALKPLRIYRVGL
ncbi:MAG: phosphoglycerate dehydrogenase [Planctomycetota bacterium]